MREAQTKQAASPSPCDRRMFPVVPAACGYHKFSKPGGSLLDHRRIFATGPEEEQECRRNPVLFFI